MSTTQTGQVDATVLLLTQTQAREQFPNLFEVNDGEEYFNELPAHGNATWVDYWPDMVLIVRAATGDPVVALNASAWHMERCGFTVPDGAL